MNCLDRDGDLLLLSHNELGIVRQLDTNIHLLYCGRCQAQLREFGKVSRVMAQILGPTREQRPAGAAFVRSKPMPPKRFVIAAVAAIVLAASLASLTALVARDMILRPRPVDCTVPVAPTPCAPGLPSDKCK